MYFERFGVQTLNHNELSFEGDWATKGNGRVAEEPGNFFEGKFKGNTVVWEGLRDKKGGIATVSIDGKVVAEVDQYGYTDVHVGRMDQREVPFRWHITNLSGGEHNFKVTILSKKNSVSQGTNVNVSRLLVYP